MSDAARRIATAETTLAQTIKCHKLAPRACPVAWVVQAAQELAYARKASC